MTKSSTSPVVARPIVRRAFDRMSVSLDFKNPSLTRQADKDSCDVNRILARYAKDGVLSHVNNHPGTYADVAEIGVADYHEALNRVISAGQAFDALPSAVREFYKNDPALFLAAVENGTLDPSLYKDLGITLHAEQKPPQGASGRGTGEASAGGTSGPTPEKGSSE